MTEAYTRTADRSSFPPLVGTNHASFFLKADTAVREVPAHGTPLPLHYMLETFLMVPGAAQSQDEPTVSSAAIQSQELPESFVRLTACGSTDAGPHLTVAAKLVGASGHDCTFSAEFENIAYPPSPDDEDKYLQAVHSTGQAVLRAQQVINKI